MIDGKAWHMWLVQHRHARFLGGVASLLVIAVFAGAHKVLPGMRPPAMPRHHMIERQVSGVTPAVHALPAIPSEDLLAREPYLRPWPPDHVDEPDYRRQDESCAGCVEHFAGRFEDFSFAAKHKDERAPHIAYVERLVVLVKHEDGCRIQTHAAFARS